MNWQEILATAILIIGIIQFIACAFASNTMGCFGGIIMMFCGTTWLYGFRLELFERRLRVIEEDIKKLKK